VHNGADFGSEKILWARSMELAKDTELCRAYPDRALWKVSTDDMGVSVTRHDICNLTPTTDLLPPPIERDSSR